MQYPAGVKPKEHTCRLPLFRVKFGQIITCPVCGTRWIGDWSDEGVWDAEVLGWTRFEPCA